MKKSAVISFFLSLCILLTACGGKEANTQETPTGFERVFDTRTVPDAAEELLNIFRISASQLSWSSDNADDMMNQIGGAVFKSMVEDLYKADTGKEFSHNSDGYTDIDNYIEYGTKYFYLNPEYIRQKLTESTAYNPEDDTVFMSDGLGSVMALKAIEVVKNGEWYIIDYIITCGYEYDNFRFGKLSFTVNEDGSFRFSSNINTGFEHQPAYNLSDRIQHPAIASMSKGVPYSLYYGPSVNLWDKTVREVILHTEHTKQYTSLGFITADKIADAGFFSNGDIYTMDTNGMKVFACDVNRQTPIFTTYTNFPGGYGAGTGSDYRYIYAIRRDPENFDYMVVYSQSSSVHEPANDFQLKATYKIGLLDKEGNLTRSIDTGIPVIYRIGRFESVYMSVKDKDNIEFFVKYGEDELMRATVNIADGSCDILKEYIPGGENEKALLLAEKYMYKLGVILADDWDSEDGTVESAIYLGALERLYYTDNRRKMPVVQLADNVYGYDTASTVADYADVAEKYFGWNRHTFEEYLRSGYGYIEENDAVIHGDYGWRFYPQITSVEQISAQEYSIYYDLLGPEDEILSHNVIKAQMLDNYFRFISNTVTKVQ